MFDDATRDYIDKLEEDYTTAYADMLQRINKVVQREGFVTLNAISGTDYLYCIEMEIQFNLTHNAIIMFDVLEGEVHVRFDSPYDINKLSDILKGKPDGIEYINAVDIYLRMMKNVKIISTINSELLSMVALKDTTMKKIEKAERSCYSK